MLLQPVLENCIKHGFTASVAHGLIRIAFRLRKKEALMEIEISDNGIGIRASEKLKKLNPSHKSTAVEVIATRLSLIKNKKGILGTIVMFDNQDERVETQGTIVRITIPI